MFQRILFAVVTVLAYETSSTSINLWRRRGACMTIL